MRPAKHKCETRVLIKKKCVVVLKKLQSGTLPTEFLACHFVLCCVYLLQSIFSNYEFGWYI